MSAPESYSRAVEFAVDERNGTVSQVWRYGEANGERLYAGFQGGAMRLPRTGNTFITYGGVCSINGKPASGPDRFDPGEADLRDKIDICARLIEVTPDNEIVLDLTVGGGADDPKVLSAFRSNTSRRGSRKKLARRLGRARRYAMMCCDYFASGSGRIWNFTTLGRFSLPPSRWNMVRLE